MATAGGRVRLPLADLAVDAVTMDEAVARIVRASAAGIGGLVVTPNVDHLRMIHDGDWLGAVYAEADLVLADGMPLLWAARLAGTPLPERVAGSELLWALCAAAGPNRRPVYLLGGAEGAAQRAAARLTDATPSLEIVGISCPPRGFERQPGAIEEIAREVDKSGAAILFTALGTPKQELLLAALRPRLPDVWLLGVGAGFDMASGTVRTAPRWARRTGLEWAYRLVREPTRLWRRYLVHDVPFAARLLAAAARSRQVPPPS